MVDTKNNLDANEISKKADELKKNDVGPQDRSHEEHLDVQHQFMDDDGMTNQHYVEKANLRKENSWSDVKKNL
jgi:hypothetical protein